MTNVAESWLPIPGYPKYLVSDKGKIKNVKSGRILKQRVHKLLKGKITGLRVDLKNGDSVKSFHVHRLVMLTFEPFHSQSDTVDHIDRNPQNNALTNLRWATSKLQIQNRSIVRKSKKITMQDLNDIYERSKKETLSNIAPTYGIPANELNKLLIYLHPDY